MERRDPWDSGEDWGFYHGEDLTAEAGAATEGAEEPAPAERRMEEGAEGMKAPAERRMEEAYGILESLAPIRGAEWWDTDRATRSFPLVVDGQNMMATCVWEPSLIHKGDVKIYLNGGAGAEGEFVVKGEDTKGGPGVDGIPAKVLETLRALKGNAAGLMGFDVGNGKLAVESGDWDDVADAEVYRKGAGNDSVVMNRAAYLYEIMARFTDALDFLIRRIVRESGQRPRDLRDKMVNQFVIPVVVGGKRVELTGKLVGTHFPLEARVETTGELKIGDGETIIFREFGGSTTPNFIEDEVHFPYQGMENIARQVEVMDGERMAGGLNNFGATRLYGRQRKDNGGSERRSIQHFLNESGNTDEVVAKLGRMVAILEGLQGAVEGEVGQMRRRVLRKAFEN